MLSSGAGDADTSIASILKVGAASKDQLANLVKFGIIDPRFSSSLGDLFLQIMKSEAQVEVFAKASKLAGKEITNQTELTAELNENYSKQMKTAETLAKDLAESGGKMTIDLLQAAAKLENYEIDTKTAEIIVQSAELENVVGDIQRLAFDTLTNHMGDLGEVTANLVISFGKLLKKAGIDISDAQSMSNKLGIDVTETTEGSGRFKRKIYTDEKTGQRYNQAGQLLGEPIKNNHLGGGISSGMLSMVGEAGPELMRFGRSGEIINNATTNDIMSAASGIVQAMQEVKSYSAPAPMDTAVQAFNKANNPRATAEGITLEDINNTLRTIASIDQQTLRQIQRQTKFEY